MWIVKDEEGEVYVHELEPEAWHSEGIWVSKKPCKHYYLGNTEVEAFKGLPWWCCKLLVKGDMICRK